MSKMSNNLIFKVENLHKRYEDSNNVQVVFEGINLEIRRNEKVAITSPSGRGKTTLLNMLAAIDNFNGGDITYYPKDQQKGISYTKIKNKDELREKYFGFIFQVPYMLKSFNVLENVCIPLKIQKKEKIVIERKAKNILRILFDEGLQGVKDISDINKEIDINAINNKNEIVKLINLISNEKITLSENEIKNFEIKRDNESINEIYLKTKFREYVILKFRSQLKLFMENIQTFRDFIPFLNKKREYSLFNKTTNLLSGGELQRVAIARAIIHNPDVIFADEPTGNLDKENAEKVLDLLKDICDEYKSTLILVTHSEQYARKYCDRVLKIENKKEIKDVT